MIVEKFECDDNYEAEKLAGFLATQKDNGNFLLGIVALVQNEVVIILKDKSSHSITMKDRHTAVRLKSFIEDVLAQKKGISASSFNDQVAEITIR
ncbi:MAG TPA: hypothetical protein VFI73_01360 [Candidatus Nitrosopolaris sp.]|nr:hypothetical protein [Candidatus Nitrosopolaris sp.]